MFSDLFRRFQDFLRSRRFGSICRDVNCQRLRKRAGRPIRLAFASGDSPPFSPKVVFVLESHSHGHTRFSTIGSTFSRLLEKVLPTSRIEKNPKIPPKQTPPKNPLFWPFWGVPRFGGSPPLYKRLKLAKNGLQKPQKVDVFCYMDVVSRDNKHPRF